MIGKTISHYKIFEKLGEGGMGVVYKAEDTKLERFVAIKVLPAHMTSDEEAKTRFIREARAASALEHPNICHIHEIGETPDGYLYMVMPCYEGETLRERLERGPLEVAEALDIITQVTSALSRAHEKGIVHRDIKPGNVMLTDGGRQATLMDFGLAKKLDATKVTRTGTAIGTVAYMSPEQLQGIEVDQRTDIWSLGVVLYEMLTGSLPFQGEYEPAVIYSIMNEEPEPVTRIRKGVPPGVENAVEKALVKDVTRRYQTVSELLSDLEEQRDQLELGIKQRRFIKIRRKTRNRLLRIGLPAVVIAVVAFVLFVVQPFELEIRPRTKEAIAQENSMAIMFFENMVDPQDKVTAQVVTSLLNNDLGESEYIRVLSEQRQYDILKELGKESGQRTLDRGVVKEVAQRANVNWIGTGKILFLEPTVVLTFEITHAVTGELRNTQRVQGEAGEDIFAVVDKLTSEIRADLSLPEEAEAEADRSVAEMMTESLDAYRYYLEGMDYFYEFRLLEAVKRFRKALEYDSTFALAHFRMAMATFPSGLPGFDEAIEKAVKYSDNVPEMEKQYIRAIYSYNTEGVDAVIQNLELITQRFPEEKEIYYWLGIYYTWWMQEYDKAIWNFRKALELDPNYVVAYNDLTAPYAGLGDYENALWSINQCIFLAPDDANPHDTKGGFLGWMGELDKSIESYKRALEIDSTFYSSNEYLAHMYIYKRNYPEAEANFRKVLISPDKDYRSAGWSGLASISMYQGKLDEALRILDRGIADDIEAKAGGIYHAKKFIFRTMIYYEQEEYDLALEAFEHAIDIYRKDYPNDPIWANVEYRHNQIQLITKKGDFAGAQEIADSIKSSLEKTGSIRSDYWLVIGLIEYARGDFEEAIAALVKAVDAKVSFPSRYMLAKVYVELNRSDDAIPVLEAAASRYDFDQGLDGMRLSNPILAVKLYYLLGIAYEQSGRVDEAIEQYEEFLETWKDADPYLEEVPDARQRIAKLRTG